MLTAPIVRWWAAHPDAMVTGIFMEDVAFGRFAISVMNSELRLYHDPQLLCHCTAEYAMYVLQSMYVCHRFSAAANAVAVAMAGTGIWFAHFATAHPPGSAYFIHDLRWMESVHDKCVAGALALNGGSSNNEGLKLKLQMLTKHNGTAEVRAYVHS